MIDITLPYVKGEEQIEFNSLSARVELWKLAWHVGQENIMFGFGPGNTKRVIKDYARQDPHWKEHENLIHIHNQFLQTFAMTGLVGLLSLLVLVSCHFWIFVKYLRKQYSLEVRCLALSGLLLRVAYLIKSIPGVPYFGKQCVVMYGFASATIWGCLLGALRESGSDTHRLDATETNVRKIHFYGRLNFCPVRNLDLGKLHLLRDQVPVLAG
jgi:O-antigen ligase